MANITITQSGSTITFNWGDYFPGTKDAVSSSFERTAMTEVSNDGKQIVIRFSDKTQLIISDVEENEALEVDTVNGITISSFSDLTTNFNNSLTQASSTTSIKTGSYTGDGTTSQAITGIGFSPKFVKVYQKSDTPGTAIDSYETFAELLDDDPSGMSLFNRPAASPPHAVIDDAIISLDSDGFTVDDDGVDSHPNKNLQVYNYYAIG